MQAARLELKFSQKELAQKVNEKPTVIQEYESGKAIPSPQILAKLERTLCVKLRGLCFDPSNLWRSVLNASSRFRHREKA